MGIWNHRVMRHVEPNGDVWYAIHEAYYDEAGEPTSWTESPTEPFGETPEELAADLEHMQKALAEPVLEYTRSESLAKTYLVTYEHDGAMWLARIGALDGCHTQGATIDEARTRIREALALFDDHAADAVLVDDVRSSSPPLRP